ncbi:hypothetical protein OPW41_19715 [Vibrio europaeus]|uniref:Lipoprotein n=1 Tax=Vibrio europaeus TaxID=300876 RepID=A0A178JGI0_9VIBR|nr:hypothetical protein [Vibrio europaeus]MDC5707044.1 hypothetical protein [Vibrio europaeus]MDC5712409.1 hypothetical protein [Vibrio europaeus]MDC5717052.1 hypothetical protein [Vibrio europaeus]MDC5721414.1 hypothetical protein [Vibrio europaeus]MDC5726352.1 hypothetical protein [Vibrio europaeus]
MKLKTIIASAVASLTLAGCATHDHINKDEVAQIKSVAVVMYNVPAFIEPNTEKPEQIEHSQGGGFDSGDLLGLAGNMVGGVAKDVTDFATQAHIKKRIDGQEAANLALPNFVTELAKKEGWKVKSPSEVLNNATYRAETANLIANDEIKSLTSFGRATAGPADYANLTLPSSYNVNVPYYETEAFKQFAAKSARALDVDAVIVLSDTGFATDQTGLFSGGKCYSKSAFHYAMFNINGEKVLETRASFDQSNIVEKHGCVNGKFLEKDYRRAMQQHGKDQADAISIKLKELRA